MTSSSSGVGPKGEGKFSATRTTEVVTSCLACHCPDLYLQKDFPRKIAIPIVIAGAIAVPWTFGISLIVVALIDFVLYQIVPTMIVCYRCHAEHRGYTKNPAHIEFDRHKDELYRYR